MMPTALHHPCLCSPGTSPHVPRLPLPQLKISLRSNLSLSPQGPVQAFVGAVAHDRTPAADDTASPREAARLHHSPVKPGVRAASFFARASLLRLSSNLSGRRWTLKIDDLPLMSGGPERERHRWPGRGHLQPLHQGQEDPPLHVCTAHSTTRPGPELPVAETTHRSHPFSSPFLTVGPLVRTIQAPGWLLWQLGTWAGMS